MTHDVKKGKRAPKKKKSDRIEGQKNSTLNTINEEFLTSVTLLKSISEPVEKPVDINSLKNSRPIIGKNQPEHASLHGESIENGPTGNYKKEL